MSSLYLVPLVSISLPNFASPVIVPEYSTDSGDPLFGATYACIPLTGCSLGLIATAPNPALASEDDVFPFPSDLSQEMSDADITALSTVLANANIPTDFLVPGITYASAARTIGQIAQTLQAAAGSGNPIQLGPTINIGSPGNAQNGGSIGNPGGSSQNADLLSAAAAYTGSLVLDPGDGGVSLGGAQ